MKTVLSLLSLLVFSSVCRAQDYDDIPSRFIRVACFGTVIDEAFYLDGKKRIDLDLIPGTLSFELPLPSGPNLNIFRMAPNPDPNLEAKPQLIGTIPLVKGASKQIVVLSLPEDVSKDPIRGKAFKDSNSIHPAETVRLFNLSPKEVAMRIKDEVQSYLPGESGTMPWKAQKHRPPPTRSPSETREARSGTSPTAGNGRPPQHAGLRLHLRDHRRRKTHRDGPNDLRRGLQ